MSQQFILQIVITKQIICFVGDADTDQLFEPIGDIFHGTPPSSLVQRCCGYGANSSLVSEFYRIDLALISLWNPHPCHWIRPPPCGLIPRAALILILTCFRTCLYG